MSAIPPQRAGQNYPGTCGASGRTKPDCNQGLSPKTTMPEHLDAALCEDIRSELQWDPSLDATKITPAVRNGDVTLSGYVHSIRERMAAETITKSLPGVIAVENRLVIRLTIGAARTNSGLAGLIQSILEGIGLESCSVSVRDGIVALNGEVEWQHQKRAAEEALTGIIGIRDFDNRLRITPKSPATYLQSELKAALHRRGLANSVQLQINLGQVTLYGVVQSCAEREEVTRIAWSGRGVRSVNDRLIVRPHMDRPFLQKSNRQTLEAGD
jgi:osmotically-inducible protein OsmY